MNSPLRSLFQFNKKRVSLDNKREDVYVVRIGRVSDHAPPTINDQLKMDCSPPRINSLLIQQQAFHRVTELCIAHVHVDLFVDDEMPVDETAIMLTTTPLAEKSTPIKSVEDASKMGGDI